MIADFTGSAEQAVGPGERDLRGHGLGDLQRVPAPDRPDDPAQRGLLPAVHDHRAAGHDRELLVPGARGGRQHGDQPAHHRHGLRRACRRRSPSGSSAACGGTSSPFLFGGIDPRTGEPYAHFHFEGVGWGGRHGLDGNNMVVTINGNCRNTPVEVFETRYPAFRIESYRLVADSGGPGEFRGGLGGERIFTVTVPEVTVSALLNRMKTEPWGVLGGGEGARRRALGAAAPATSEWRTFVEEFGTMSPSKFSGVSLQRRSGEPDAGRRRLRRSHAPRPGVGRDIIEGFVSAELFGATMASRDAGSVRVEIYGRRSRRRKMDSATSQLHQPGTPILCADRSSYSSWLLAGDGRRNREMVFTDRDHALRYTTYPKEADKSGERERSPVRQTHGLFATRASGTCCQTCRRPGRGRGVAGWVAGVRTR